MSLVVPIVGGLGNQMFLLATGIATALRCKLELRVPAVEYSDSCFEPRPVYWDTMFKNIPTVAPAALSGAPPILLAELAKPEALHVPDATKSYALGGFFQSARYFDDHRGQVLEQLVSGETHEKAMAAFNTLNPDGRHTLGVHIRRGDYLRMSETFEILGPQQYYLEAVAALYGGLIHRKAFRETFRIVLFSEDKEYAEILAGTLRARFSLRNDDVTVSAIPEDYVELVAMSRCHDIVIANSSYSWWAAYLHEVPMGRVVAPAKWFVGRTPQDMEHIYCDRWVVI